MKGIYNPKKLTTDRERFHKIRVLNIGDRCGRLGGGGARGQALPVARCDRRRPLRARQRRQAQLPCPYARGRRQQQGSLSRAPRAAAARRRLHGKRHRLRISVRLGPEALADYDVIVCAVDNNAAKVLLNELVRRLPEERRPVVIMDGTHGEMAQSVMLDNRDFCLRCLMDESWMKDASVPHLVHRPARPPPGRPRPGAPPRPRISRAPWPRTSAVSSCALTSRARARR